jgi:rhomboid protease GluP
MPDSVWQYKASWRSSMGMLTMMLLLFAGICALLAFAGPRFSIGLAAGAAFLGWLAWALGKPLFTRDWIVRIGPRGISGYLLNGRTVPWRDIRDVGVETVQRNTFLVLHLAADATESLEKTRRMFSGRKPERCLVLTALRKEDIAQATAAALATFAERAGSNAAAAVAARREEARFEEEFAQKLVQRTGTTWALYLVVALNVLAWLGNVLSGVSPFAPASADLFRWGANSAWAVTRDHEYWRLLTGTFLHGGVIHLGMNMLGLWSAGLLLNRLYGNAQFLLVYFLSALAGASASLHFGAQTAVSVGASGAVFGVVAALVAAVRKHRGQVPKALAQQIMTSEAVFLVYALFNGFVRDGIDNAAHVGGLLAGAAMGWVLMGVVGDARRGTRIARGAALAAAVLVAIGAMVASTPSPRVDHGTMFAATGQLQVVMPKGQAAHAALHKDLQEAKAGRMAQQQLVQAVQDVHLPALRRVHAELAQVPRAQGSPLTELTADMQQLTAVTIEGLELEVRASQGQARPEDPDRGESLKREMQLVSQRLQDRLAAQKAKQKS